MPGKPANNATETAACGKSHCCSDLATTPEKDTHDGVLGQAAILVTAMDEDISNFVSITGASADVAGGFLQLAGGDFERAVGLYFENPDLVSGVGAGITGDQAAAGNRPSSTPQNQHSIGQQDESGVIHISDDDDDDDVMQIEDDDDVNRETDRVAVAQAVALAQEEEDAAMAKRLQEELYQGGQGSGEDAVRAPIARTTETLVAPDAGWGGDDEMESAFLDQLRRRRHPPRKFSLSPFSTQPADARQPGPADHLANEFGEMARRPPIPRPRTPRTHGGSRSCSGRRTSSCPAYPGTTPGRWARRIRSGYWSTCRT